MDLLKETQALYAEACARNPKRAFLYALNIHNYLLPIALEFNNREAYRVMDWAWNIIRPHKDWTP